MVGLDQLPRPDDAEFLYDQATSHGSVRRANLQRYLTLIAAGRPKWMLIGEAPGHRGTTVTGIPFMSAREALSRPGLISRDPLGDGFELGQYVEPCWEATSGAVWKALSAHGADAPLLWSTYPHHPFIAGDKSTNRRPRPAEAAAGIRLALQLANLFRIEEFVAVGRLAEGSLLANGIRPTVVRHPAQGGAKIFADQMQALLSQA